MKKNRLALPLLLAVIPLVILATLAFAFELPKWFPFSNKGSLDEWESKIFKGRTIYTIELDKAGGSLHALSHSSASAIFYRIKHRFKAQDFPMLSWRWKVVKFPDKEKLKGRQGIERDDYASRVYVIFPSMFILSSKVLEYVWDETTPSGTISDSPYSSNIKLFVVQSGRSDPPKWEYQERNILADYRKAFGRDPVLKVGALALMSDADNSKDTAEAYFSDIKIGYAKVR